MKNCKYCKEDLDESEFYVARVVKGVTYYRRKCKTCLYKTRMKYRHKQRKLLIDYKKTLKCERCGFSDHRALHPGPGSIDWSKGGHAYRGSNPGVSKLQQGVDHEV